MTLKGRMGAANAAVLPLELHVWRCPLCRDVVALAAIPSGATVGGLLEFLVTAGVRRIENYDLCDACHEHVTDCEERAAADVFPTKVP